MVCHRDKFTTSNPRSYEKYFYRLGRSRIGQGHGRSEREEEKRRKKRWATAARRDGAAPERDAAPSKDRNASGEIPRASRRPDPQTGFWRFVIWRNATSGGSVARGWRMVGR